MRKRGKINHKSLSVDINLTISKKTNVKKIQKKYYIYTHNIHG